MGKALELGVAGQAARRRGTRVRAPFLFLLTLPTLLVVFLVFGIPLAYSVNLSLHRVNMLTKQLVWVGFQNYAEILPNPDFLWALGRTAYFAVVTVLGGLVLGMPMALVLNARSPGRNVLRSVVLIPWAMSPVAVGILWGWIFDGTYGTLNALLFDLHLIDRSIPWLASGWWAFHIVALVHVWNQAPLTCLLILAGLQSLPENLTSAARIDGAGPWQRFLKITLPWLRPMLLLVMILTSINSIMAFDLFWTMTKGGPGSATTVFSWMGYAYAFQFFRFGEGAAILFVLSLICLVLAVIYLRLFLATGGSTTAAADVPLAAFSARGVARESLLRLPARPPRRHLLSAGARRALGRVGLGLAAVLIFVWSFGPFLWLVVMSLSPSADLVRTPPTLIPHALTVDNFRFVLFPTAEAGHQGSIQATRVPFSILNSLIVAAGVTAVNLVLGTLAGYAYARAKGSRLMSGTLWALMITRMTPSLALILPFFIMFCTIGLLSTRPGPSRRSRRRQPARAPRRAAEAPLRTPGRSAAPPAAPRQVRDRPSRPA